MIRLQLRRNNSAFLAIALISAVALASGCKKQQPEAPQQAPAPAAQPVQQAAKQEAAPVQKPVSSAVKLAPPPAVNQFDFSNKKDPFKPLIVAKPVAVTSGSDSKQAGFSGLPIHSFDVSQFKLIGIITGAKENQAMVVDPGGKGYVLKVGMTIGKNEGRVTAISSAGVDVVEQFKDDNGRVRKEVIKITLPRKQ